MTGILWRSAEGYVKHWCAVAGVILAAAIWPVVYRSLLKDTVSYLEPVFLPDKFGWGGALIITLGALAVFYMFLDRIVSRKKRRS
ncbi:MAG: hypothetical protein C4560_06935 [Nitrospiraceae bacterium]|nr:MAG: hypothetical protein C4560_06935 [Nitrospiraceae bacterium]